MPNKTSRTKKVTLSPADRKHVRRIVAKTKMTEQQVAEKALTLAQPLLKLIAQTLRARKGSSKSSYTSAAVSLP